MCMHFMLYTIILTNNHNTWSTHFYCFISQGIDHTVVFKWRIRVSHFCTAFPCSCFVPLLDILRTRFHNCGYCCWVYVFRVWKKDISQIRLWKLGPDTLNQTLRHVFPACYIIHSISISKECSGGFKTGTCPKTCLFKGHLSSVVLW